ncbi:MBL fold metallo-hydrolase [Nocardia sp. NPDC049707]|uniref:MBL fold metallo-hydrolase n=1 Tax=Nocardia sp. NPDC049707 TaxID=3154735 RepID=UPI00341EB9CD
MTSRTDPARLGFSVFTAPEKALVGERPKPFGPPLGFDAATSTLIYGAYDAVLVDALHTVAEATALADWVGLHHRNLTTIYITHGHLDHFYGLSVLLDRFPNAKAIATPKTVELIEQTDPELSRFFESLLPGQSAPKITAPEPISGDTFTLERHELRIIEQGQTDTLHSTSLHIPSIDLVVAGDVLYNKCHMYVGETTPESRDNWIAALDRLTALHPKHAVAGHKKTGAPDTPETIEESQQYLRDFGRLKESTLSDEELFNEMGKLYPDWASHQSWLMFGFS